MCGLDAELPTVQYLHAVAPETCDTFEGALRCSEVDWWEKAMTGST